MKTQRPAPVPPEEISELVACVGPALALRLIELRGGTRVHVPTRGGVRDSWLLAHLGEAALLRLSEAFGGMQYRVPLCRRWRACMYLWQGGRSHAEIAMLVSCSEKYVQTLAGADWTPMPSHHKALRDSAAASAARPVQLAFLLD